MNGWPAVFAHLAPFPEHQELYSELWEMVSHPTTNKRVIAVVGPCGSGGSSMIRALASAPPKAYQREADLLDRSCVNAQLGTLIARGDSVFGPEDLLDEIFAAAGGYPPSSALAVPEQYVTAVLMEQLPAQLAKAGVRTILIEDLGRCYLGRNVSPVLMRGYAQALRYLTTLPHVTVIASGYEALAEFIDATPTLAHAFERRTMKSVGNSFALRRWVATLEKELLARLPADLDLGGRSPGLSEPDKLEQIRAHSEGLPGWIDFHVKRAFDEFVQPTRDARDDKTREDFLNEEDTDPPPSDPD